MRAPIGSRMFDYPAPSVPYMREWEVLENIKPLAPMADIPKVVSIFDGINDLGLDVCKNCHPSALRMLQAIHCLMAGTYSSRPGPTHPLAAAAVQRLIAKMEPTQPCVAITIHVLQAPDSTPLPGTWMLQCINMAGEVVCTLQMETEKAPVAEVRSQIRNFAGKRMAWDCNAYVRAEFIDYYGEEVGNRLWHNAPAPLSALRLLSPNGFELKDGYDICLTDLCSSSGTEGISRDL